YNPSQRGGGAAAAVPATRASAPGARASSDPISSAPGARGATPNMGSLAGSSMSGAGSGGQSFAQGGRPRSAADEPAYPPLPRKGSKIVPLGSPETQFRILPHDFHEQHMPGTLPKR